MKKLNKWLLSFCAMIASITLAAGCEFALGNESVTESSITSVDNSENSSTTTPETSVPEVEAPEIPVLTLNNGVLAWTAVEGETYEYKIGLGKWTATDGASLDLTTLVTESTTVSVRAGKDGLNSEAATQEITVVQLGIPEQPVATENGFTWTAVENVTEYEVSVNGGAWKKTTETAWTASAPGIYRIQVRTVGYIDGATFYLGGEASSYSNTLTVKPEAFSLTVNNAVITWTVADGVAYEVKVGNGEWTANETGSVDCTAYTQTTTVSVREKVNGVYSDPATQTITVVTLEKPVISETVSALNYAVANGKVYEVTLNGVTTQEGTSVEKATAVGNYSYTVKALGYIDGATIYLASEVSDAHEYSIKPAAPVLNVNNAVISWTAVEGVAYEVKVGEGEWKANETGSVDCTAYTQTTTVSVRAKVNGVYGDAATQTITVVTLATPVATVNAGSIVWEAVANAKEYVISVNGDEATQTATTWTTAEKGDYVVTVKAVGYADGETVYLASEATTAPTLSVWTAPTLTKDENTVEWTEPETQFDSLKLYVDGVDKGEVDGNSLNLVTEKVVTETGIYKVKLVATKNGYVFESAEINYATTEINENYLATFEYGWLNSGVRNDVKGTWDIVSSSEALEGNTGDYVLRYLPGEGKTYQIRLDKNARDVNDFDWTKIAQISFMVYIPEDTVVKNADASNVVISTLSGGQIPFFVNFINGKNYSHIPQAGQGETATIEKGVWQEVVINTTGMSESTINFTGYGIRNSEGAIYFDNFKVTKWLEDFTAPEGTSKNVAWEPYMKFAYSDFGNVNEFSFGSEYANKYVNVTLNVKGNVVDSDTSWKGFAAFADSAKKTYKGRFQVATNALHASNVDWTAVTLELPLNAEGKIYLATGCENYNATPWCDPYAIFVKDWTVNFAFEGKTSASGWASNVDADSYILDYGVENAYKYVEISMDIRGTGTADSTAPLGLRHDHQYVRVNTNKVPGTTEQKNEGFNWIANSTVTNGADVNAAVRQNSTWVTVKFKTALNAAGKLYIAASQTGGGTVTARYTVYMNNVQVNYENETGLSTGGWGSTKNGYILIDAGIANAGKTVKVSALVKGTAPTVLNGANVVTTGLQIFNRSSAHITFITLTQSKVNEYAEESFTFTLDDRGRGYLTASQTGNPQGGKVNPGNFTVYFKNLKYEVVA